MINPSMCWVGMLVLHTSYGQVNNKLNWNYLSTDQSEWTHKDINQSQKQLNLHSTLQSQNFSQQHQQENPALRTDE